MKKTFFLILCTCLFFITVKATEKTDTVSFQLGFITPLSTNGRASSQTVNKVSLNLWGGYSRGNLKFEAAGLYNINTSLTRGVQFAGMLNLSGHGIKSHQFAGIANYNREQSGGTQFAGMLNKAAKGNIGFQAAGIINLAETTNTQLAGMANISEQNKVQLAGIFNKAENNNVQIAGFMNVAKNTNAQIAGILNVAKNVKSTQIGLINISENCEGTPVGLVNIVKNNGKKEFEIAFSEVLTTSVSFRLGVDHLYTIFSAGINYINNPVEFAAGIGFGTHINWKNNWSNQIEIMGYTITEDGKFTDVTNMLTQLRIPVTIQLSNGLKLFAGPVFNLIISDYTDSETGKTGSSLYPYSVWDNKNDKPKLNAWPGFTAGLRF